MLKYNFINFFILFIIAVCCNGTVVRIPNLQNQLSPLDDKIVFYGNDQKLPWQSHVMDFINLVKVDKIISTAVRYIDDPEVMRFIGFFLSPTFKNMIREVETMEEFKEAYLFLATKGYDVKDLIDTINTALTLPEFGKPQEITRSKGSVADFIAAIIGTMPLQEMKDLLKSKVKTYPEVAEFVEVVRSPEFISIIERLLSSNKFGEFKSTFESYGVDFNSICGIITEVIGDEYENVICGHTHIEKQYL